MFYELENLNFACTAVVSFQWGFREKKLRTENINLSKKRVLFDKL